MVRRVPSNVKGRLEAVIANPAKRWPASRDQRSGEETILVVALRSNPEKPKAVRIIQAIEARAASPTAKFDSARSSRTSSLIQQFRVAVRA
jgi:hypothetical protein